MSEVLLARIAELEAQLEDLTELEKAKRTHLRADTEKAKADAYLLLSEWILPAAQTLLITINRPSPDPEKLNHYADVIREHCEKAIPKFI